MLIYIHSHGHLDWRPGAELYLRANADTEIHNICLRRAIKLLYKEVASLGTSRAFGQSYERTLARPAGNYYSEIYRDTRLILKRRVHTTTATREAALINKRCNRNTVKSSIKVLRRPSSLWQNVWSCLADNLIKFALSIAPFWNLR